MAQGPIFARNIFNTDIQLAGSTLREFIAVLEAVKCLKYKM